jgi:hypothetical protein
MSQSLTTAPPAHSLFFFFSIGWFFIPQRRLVLLKKNRFELCGVIVVLAMNPSYWAGPCIGNIIYKYVLSYSPRYMQRISEEKKQNKKKRRANLSPQQHYRKKKIYFFHRGQNLKFKPIIEIPYENA